jgi:hypothetical protein
VPQKERRFLADALDNPDMQLLPLGRMYEAIEQSRRGANKVKREEPVMVVIGNPPYADKAKGTAEWIETPSSTRQAPSLRAFRKLGNGRLEYVLSNKYVYFWRWATWKTFDAHPEHPSGIAAFVCSAGFLAGPGFAGMREYLRRTTDEGWVIDLTPEGHQPPMDSRFFRGNQQPICIAVFIRRGEPSPTSPARIYRTVVTGTVEEKAAALDALRLNDSRWEACADGWPDPFQPAGPGSWTSMPSVVDLMPWAVPGVKPNRTWVYAPEPETLRKRWAELVRAPIEAKPALLKETTDTKVNSQMSLLPGMIDHAGTLALESSPCPEPRRIGHRSFDRKWTIPDARLHHRPSPSLWLTDSRKQIFVVEQHAHPISDGPALVFSALIPDMHFFMGHHGGRAMPLYRNAEATIANVTSKLLGFLTEQLNCAATPVDLVAYLAAVTAHPGFTRRFATELKTPGVRIPITRERSLWNEAIHVGKEVLWLHTYGERCADPASGRRADVPRMAEGRPKVLVEIPDTDDGMPEKMTYDEPSRTLHVGGGQIAPVAPDVVAYKVSGMPVLKHWFGYRKKNPAGKRTSPLDSTIATTWTPAMTTELLDLLNVLGRCVALEPRQDSLLDRIIVGPLITIDELIAAAVLPVHAAARRIPKPSDEPDLFSTE